ncbi:MAG: 6,7-dimethyl-8-ribityllumazine synthase [Gammaproteobacteria bacterium]|nr:6,7-dimethyl-8-ribityllumazine synthase [Gammaproteobacteria bacterium]MYF37960.1 6,7-dimethyl-8-ribityllumazine synthase [Gammaproteobacteria bacterium]
MNTDELPRVPDARVAILTSKWHAEYVNNIADRCEQILVQQAAVVQRHQLPGTYEFPYAVRILKENDSDLVAIVCIGIVLKGETRHFEMIVNSCAFGLTKASIDYDVIVINGIIPATDEKQIVARATTDQFNKGIELASAAIETIAWTRAVRGH